MFESTFKEGKPKRIYEITKGKHTEDLRIERKIHKSTKLVPTHTLTDQLIMKICRRVANQSRKIG